MSFRVVIQKVLGLWVNSGSQAAGGAGYTARHRKAYHAQVDRQGAKSPTSLLCRMTGRLRRLNQRIEDCWIGDLIGAAALFVLLFVMSFIVGAIQ